MRLIQLVKGWPGKPSHPPVTDATIGAGERVLKQPETALREALIPGRADEFSTRERS